MNIILRNTFLLPILLLSLKLSAQYQPKNISEDELKQAKVWVDETYSSMSQDEKLGQLFIVSLYTNKGEDYINNVRKTVEQEQIGGLILMQDDAEREIVLLNEFQKKSKTPMLIGMDAEWGLFQRIAAAYKFPWAMTLGAIQNKDLVYHMAMQIAEDAKRMGVNWNFAPVVDVNTNPDNPIIGNRSFGSEVSNVVSSALAYSNGLQDSNVLAAIKHFPGHGDTSTDSHIDLPVVSHSLERLNKIELAPFKQLMNQGIGGVMVAHLYVPALEPQKGVPASVSKNVITGLLKEKLGYKGLIITDALNMGAVSKRYQPGQLDALAFKAGNDIMLFSENVKEGKRLIQQAIDKGEISQSRVEESVKKILHTKYFLGLHTYESREPKNVIADINNEKHQKLVQNLYANALTLLKDDRKLLPLNCDEKVYYLPLEEAPYETFQTQLNTKTTVVTIKPSDISSIPTNSKVVVGLHKDNSTAYKPYKISSVSKNVLSQLKNHNVILSVFGSPYALRDLDISKTSTVLVAYENNDDSMKATAAALCGDTPIVGRLPVLVNDKLKAGMGIDLTLQKKKNNTENSTHPMKIGILCYPTYGGSGIVATELGMSLARKGYEVHFISSNLPARLDITNPNIFFHKVNVQTYPLFQYQPYDIALSSMIYRVVTLYKLDLLHAHYAIPYAYAAFTAKQMLKKEGKDVPLVTTLHGTDITLVGQHPSYKHAVEFSINQSDTITSVSESLKKDTLKIFQITKEIEVITNFIDNQEFEISGPCNRQQFATDDEKILIHVSNLRPVKRIGEVLEIFKNVHRTIKSKLIIIGEGPDMEKISQFLEENPELIGEIRLLGKVNDLYKILQLSDVFLLPSEQESFGLAALEAMAAYTPVISSNAGGIPEVNIQGVTGFLAEIGNVEAMSNYTIKLLSDENLLAEMKKNAKEQAVKFDLQNILPLYEEMYERTLLNFNEKA